MEWVHKHLSFGFKNEDALFPNEKWLKHRPFASSLGPVPVMTTPYAVTQAFAVASRSSDTNYTPHTTKHTIGAERDARPLTQLERKAWSENMGHENEQTTESHYGKLTEDMRFGILENIGEEWKEQEMNLSESEKIALFDSLVEAIKRK